MKKSITCPKCNGWGYQCEECSGTGISFVPMTNADRIRAMSDEELAKCLVFKAKCTGCDAENCDEEFCLNFMWDWLQQPCEEDVDG